MNIADDKAAMSNIRSLRVSRHQRGLTLVQLGKCIGYSASIIGEYERGEKVPSVGIYNAIADFFGWPKYTANNKGIMANQQQSTLSLGFEENQESSSTEKSTEKEDTRLNSCIPSDLLSSVSIISVTRGMSVSEIVSEALKAYLKPYSEALRVFQRSIQEVQ